MEDLRPQTDKFVAADNSGRVTGVVLTLRGTPENGGVDEEGHPFDSLSRFFAPWLGINEDHVCGEWIGMGMC